MFNLNALVQKAQNLIDQNVASPTKSSDTKPSKAQLFRLQFRLPDSQNPLHEITAELSLAQTSRSARNGNADNPDLFGRGSNYAGKLHLSESFLCFSTQPTSFLPHASLQSSSAFTGQTNGAGPAGNGFSLPLCAIRRVERLNTPNALFALALTTWNGFTALSGRQGHSSDAQKFTMHLAGSRQSCEKFCDGLKRGLREGIKDVENLKTVTGLCYSEYMLSIPSKSEKGEVKPTSLDREPPDAGLGMLFKYPGDAKRMRDKSKMRLWGDYFKGWILGTSLRTEAHR